MLKQRVVTAILLLAVVLAALLAPSVWPLILLLTLAAAGAFWEWLRLTWPGTAGSVRVLLSVALALCMVFLAWQWLEADDARMGAAAHRVLNFAIIPLVSAIWIFIVSVIVKRGDTRARAASAGLSAFGLLAVLSAWAALVQLYIQYGAWFIVSLMALIWCADIAAYFAGKTFGRRKLAPRVSPGKTLEGALGGVAAATLWVIATAWWPDSFGSVLVQRWSWAPTVIIAVLLACVSIIGDLFESLLKRRAGVKDSSQLLPGHGGVYDRIDALLPVAPLAFLLTGVSFQ